MSNNPITFENHLVVVTSGPHASIDKILAVKENYHGPIEVVHRTATSCTFRYKTPEGFRSAFKEK